jgi:predicted AAA+ superfamily ATPase
VDIQNLYQMQEVLLHRVSLKHKRYLYNKIDWNQRLIGILGQRGQGKTTLMLQYIKEHYVHDRSVLYISLDNPYFQTVSLLEFAQEFAQLGGKILFVDEVHKYKEWSVYIKLIYDMLDLKVVFSGSSILKMHKQDGDLSRRSLVYHLENMSFREYLYITDTIDLPTYTLEELLQSHEEIAGTITAQIKPVKLFRDYMQYGAYPFVLEDKAFYHQRIMQVIMLILETDLPYINAIEIAQISKLKKLLYMLAVSVPFVPNIVDLAEATNISRPKIYEYLKYLEDAKIITSLRTREKGYKIMSKPEKIYMNNPNISYALSANSNKGSLRESFFVNQIKNYYGKQFLDDAIFVSKVGDFLVKERYVFEVGGKNKSFNQIKDVPDSYIAADDIEIGYGNKIPLWLFGFLY